MESGSHCQFSSSPSFSLGIESMFEHVKIRGPFPPPAVEMEIGDLLVSGPSECSGVENTIAPVGPTEISTEDFQAILGELDDVLLDAWVEPEWKGGKVVPRSPSLEFLQPDLDFRNTVAEGGDNPSVNQNRWALNRLKKFRQHLGEDISIELVDVPGSEAVDVLSSFFEQVTKANGKLYPSGSLMNLLGGFNRVFRRRQEERIMLTDKEEPPFTMKTSPLFRRVCVACVLAMRRSKANGVGTERKQVKVIAKKTETEILADSSMAKTHSKGLFGRVGYYCTFCFAIRGRGELHGLCQTDFSFGSDTRGKYVQYNERSSKNGKATMTRFQPEHFRGGVKDYEVDVVESFESYYRHLPGGMTEFFLGVIDNPRTLAWYTRGPMGRNLLTALVKQILEENGLDAEEFSNKSGRTTMVTRMAEAWVPNDVGMLVTGHQSEKSYAQYDRSKEAKVWAAQRCATEDCLTYLQALEQETENLRADIIDGASGESPSKRIKTGEDSVAESVSLLTSLNLDGENPVRTASTLSSENQRIDVSMGGRAEKGKRARSRDKVQDPAEWEWMSEFNWEEDLKSWEDIRSLIVNPISALLGKLVNCDGIVINFHGNVNFKS